MRHAFNARMSVEPSCAPIEGLCEPAVGPMVVFANVPAENVSASSLKSKVERRRIMENRSEIVAHDTATLRQSLYTRNLGSSNVHFEADKAAKTNNHFVTKNRSDFGKTSSYANVVKSSSEVKDSVERLIWPEIEGVPLRAWNNETFTHICNKWGEVLFVDDTDGCNRLSKRLCIKSSHGLLVFATIMVTVNKVTYAIRVRELCSWTPSFLGEDSVNNDEGFMGKFKENDVNFFENNDAKSAFGMGGDIGDKNAHNDQEHECVEEVSVIILKQGIVGIVEEPLDSEFLI
uniref:Reverse transcriptase domain, reverse transcriptase zinc-binding domain protein n=1 Tax=Tanacetum cinerariifolium TaxID=118510 RepID=A0A6L2MGI3_TANCI|nr:reverse transcriptase domain, reverse transcriptase zinc-binding domain protein [Tanacetum cinerariifolium]